MNDPNTVVNNSDNFPPEMQPNPSRVETVLEQNRGVDALTNDSLFVQEVAGQLLQRDPEAQLVMSCIQGWSRHRATHARRGGDPEGNMSLQEFLRLRQKASYRADETGAAARWISRGDNGEPSRFEVDTAEYLRQQPRPVRRS
jgi:hypothetical protein